MTSGEWLVGHTLCKVHRRRVLAQLVNLETMPISLPDTPSWLISMQCFAIVSLRPNPGWKRSVPLYRQQRLFHQLLEKHLLVFATSPLDYGFNKAIDHPIHMGDAPPIKNQYRHIPPALY